MTEFTPISAFLGGSLIGFSALMLLLLKGKVAGVSTILGKVLVPVDAGFAWRIAFLMGLVLAPLVMTGLFPDSRFQYGSELADKFNPSLVLMILAGLLVGAGTQLGSGCTSGHGICGIGRLSLRSIVATITFMLTAGVTVFIVNHLVGVS